MSVALDILTGLWVLYKLHNVQFAKKSIMRKTSKSQSVKCVRVTSSCSGRVLKNDMGIFLLKGPKIGTFALSTENQAWEVANELICQISVLIPVLSGIHCKTQVFGCWFVGLHVTNSLDCGTGASFGVV